jgi:hypothetical protein
MEILHRKSKIPDDEDVASGAYQAAQPRAQRPHLLYSEPRLSAENTKSQPQAKIASLCRELEEAALICLA